MGERVAAALEADPASLLASPLGEASLVLPKKRPRKEMRVEERLIEEYEGAQKQRYLRFARFMTKRSRPDTTLRYFYTALLAPFFAPPDYWAIPFLIVAGWFHAALRALGGQRR